MTAEVASLVAAGVSGALETCRAYQALADERGTLAAVLTSTADAVVMVNPDGVVLLAKPRGAGHAGRGAERITGRPLADAIAHEPMRRLFETGRPGIAELPLPDGRTSLVSVSTEYGRDVRRRPRHPGARSAARLRQLLPGAQRLHRRDRGNRARARHHPQPRRCPRRRIGVNSTEGAGSTFWVELPAAPAGPRP
jgi:PAS domain-containing protein